MADNIVTGRKYRIKAAENLWDIISFWTKSQDVEMDDGTTLQSSFTNLKTQTNGNTAIVNGLSTQVTNAPLYSSSSKYSKGDLVNYNGSIFKCISDITVPEVWNPAHWEAVGEAIPFRFGIDSDGNYGYIKAGADSVTPFKSAVQKILIASNASGAGTVSAEVISQRCAEYHINPNKLTSSNFVMEMVGFNNGGVYSQMGSQPSDASGTLTSPALVYSDGALTYNTGSWRQGGYNQEVWIHGARPGYDFYIDIQRPGAGNWVNGYHSDTSGTINEVIQISYDIVAKCNIYLLV